MPQRLDSPLIEGANVVFRNFEGREGPYNREGDRSFAVILEEDMAKKMLDDGWNIKRLKPREDDDNPDGAPYINVAVGFRYPPKIVLITSKGRVTLTEEECPVIDHLDVKNYDLIINPSHWNVNGKTGVKAYLKSIYITINEDALDLKYADVPEVYPENALGSGRKPLAIESSETNDGIIDVEAHEGDDPPPWDND